MSVITITILSVRAIEKMNLVILRNQQVGTSARSKKIKWVRSLTNQRRGCHQSSSLPSSHSSVLVGSGSQKVTQIASDASAIKMTLGHIEINLGSKAF